MEALIRLCEIAAKAPSQLRAISAEDAAKPTTPGKWSRKQELGHLIDSACNNHQRIVRAQLDNAPAMPGYDGDRWVELHRYQEADWNALIDLWRIVNEHLIRAASAITPDTAGRTLSVGGGDPITVSFLVTDYVDHLVHHLQHIGVAAAAVQSAS